MPKVMVLEGDDLGELRKYIWDEFGSSAKIVKAEAIKSARAGGLLRKTTYELTVAIPDTAAPGPKALGRMHRERAELARNAPPPTRDESFDDVLHGLRGLTAGAPTDVDGPSDAPAWGSAPVEQSAAEKALADLGIPQRYLSPEGLPAFLTKLERPPDLQRISGSVVAVAGLGDSGTGTAHQIADKLSVGDVVHVGPGTDLANVFDVRAWRERARMSTIANVHVGPEPGGAQAASELIAALNPMQVWAVIDARTKTADLRAWLAALGSSRRVDALAARAMTETTQPGTVLDLGVPVGLIDGAPANRVAWAAVLSEHLDDL